MSRSCGEPLGVGRKDPVPSSEALVFSKLPRGMRRFMRYSRKTPRGVVVSRYSLEGATEIFGWGLVAWARMADDQAPMTSFHHDDTTARRHDGERDWPQITADGRGSSRATSVFIRVHRRSSAVFKRIWKERSSAPNCSGAPCPIGRRSARTVRVESSSTFEDVPHCGTSN